MENSLNYQQNHKDFIPPATFINEGGNINEIISTFTNKGLINFKDGDFTSTFTLFGTEFNNAKHSLLIPFARAWEKLTNAINKERERLPNDFKWSAVAEYKYKRGQGWRLHFHLLHNYRLNIFDYAGNNNQILYNSEHFIGSYLTKDFRFTASQGIQPYFFSSNCLIHKDKLKEIVNDFIVSYKLYSNLKKQAKSKGKVKGEEIIIVPTNFIFPRCRGSPWSRTLGLPVL